PVPTARQLFRWHADVLIPVSVSSFAQVEICFNRGDPYVRLSHISQLSPLPRGDAVLIQGRRVDLREQQKLQAVKNSANSSGVCRRRYFSWEVLCWNDVLLK